MDFPAPLHPGRLLRRYQRFLADVQLDDGRQVTAHCANTGSMLGCCAPGSRVWLAPATTPGRKLAWTWELVEVAGQLVGIHTGRSNALVAEALLAGRVPGFAGHGELRREVAIGDGARRSRIDLLLEAAARPRCWIEVKNVTAAVAAGVALFPDAPSSRGRKHLLTLGERVAAGERAVLFFCVQRADVHEVRPADQIDPEYGRLLREVLAQGVEALAWRASVSPSGIQLDTPIPVLCP